LLYPRSCVPNYLIVPKIVMKVLASLAAKSIDALRLAALGIAVCLFASSCSIFISYEIVPASVEIRTAAIRYAQKYAELGAVYEWGGQDPLPRKIAVDCSGLVIRCYEYACGDYGASLLFKDTTAKGLRQYSSLIASPEKGDLIMMGDNNEISHVALFTRKEDGRLYFIDATSLTGMVSMRSYPENDQRFIEFRRMNVVRKK